MIPVILSLPLKAQSNKFLGMDCLNHWLFYFCLYSLHFASLIIQYPNSAQECYAIQNQQDRSFCISASLLNCCFCFTIYNRSFAETFTVLCPCIQGFFFFIAVILYLTTVLDTIFKLIALLNLSVSFSQFYKLNAPCFLSLFVTKQTTVSFSIMHIESRNIFPLPDNPFLPIYHLPLPCLSPSSLGVL